MTAVSRAVVLGAAGQLGARLMTALEAAGVTARGVARPTLDLDDLDGLAKLRFDADLVINAAAWTDVDGCARDPELAITRNGLAVGVLADSAERAGARFLQVSTNEVFAGTESRSYSEDDAIDPINAYGRSKAIGEKLARRASGSIVIRTAWVFGGPRSFPPKIISAAMRALEAGNDLRVVADEVGNPTPVEALARSIVVVACLSEPPASLHIAGEPPVSRHAWATRILAAAGHPQPVAISSDDYPRASTPPRHAVLDTSRSRAIGLDPISWWPSATAG